MTAASSAASRLNPKTPGLVSELALVLVTIAATLSLDRIFVGTEHRSPLITTAIVIHGVLMVTRRLRAGVFLSLVASLIALIFQVTQSLFSSTSTFGIPTRDTVDAFLAQSEAAWADFNSVRAPTLSTTGFILATTIAVWAVAFLSDWAAFRLRTAGEALAPGLAVVIFSALLTVRIPGGEVRHVIWFLAAGLFFLVAHRAAARVSTGTWLGNETSGAYLSLMAGGTAIVMLGFFAGLLVGPQTPGADEDALIELNDIGNQGPSERVAESPLIDIRSRLVDLANVEAFTVETNSPGYWRAMALDSFDGTTWTLKSDFSKAGDKLESNFQTDVTTEQVDQRFTITGLDMDWLPTAYTATGIEVETGQKVTYEPWLSTLIVDEFTPIDDMRYTITSARPIVGPDDLQNSPPATVDPRYTELPADFDPRITALAQDVISGATDDFSKAIALQDYFRRNGDFTYSLAEVPPGHSENAILDFLEARVGYCEQFAGTFAAMARSVGLPTRIAVGFTDGERDLLNPNLYRVSGKHAHSWPEVFIEGAGWLHFEPTPGRGAAASAAYTGHQQQQAGEADAVAQGAQSLPNPTPGPGALTVDSPEEPEPLPDETENDIDAVGEPTAGQDPEELGGSGTTIPRGLLYTIIGLLALVAYAIAVPLLKRSRRSNERANAQGARERVHVAWSHATTDLSLSGVGRSPSETPIEFAARASRELGIAEVKELGQMASVAAFSNDELDATIADTAESHEDAIKSILDDRASRVDRTLDELDPRPLLSRS